ncbi:YdcF family protein [Lysobacter sp. Root494]|uniref:YdcF family protein n=1 Tax=Lysobacter sp. Root494 TaxID=1736549 RepID=UPI000701AE22|nr:YdcF family protein [Lysobacter sp. Root494]KQY52459.1 hypothetical protein ASD14_07565 [Lysobacter sp. Root494]
MLAALASALSYPLYASLAIAVVGAIAVPLGFRRTALALFALAFLWTATWSVPVVSDGLRSSLEDRHVVVPEASLPSADAIVVLGGASRYWWLQREDVDPWELGSSRLAAGARAWLSKRAPIVILTGGRGGRDASEAARMKTAIQRLGVPASVLVLEERSRNTEDNAINTARLAHPLGVRRILLVTSALHMPRAMLLFERQGFEVTPVPVPEKGHRQTWRERWLPSPSALWRSGRALKEYVALMALHVESTARQRDLDANAGR